MKGVVSGKRQLSHRNSSELYNVTTVTPTWMLKSKMQLTCMLRYIFFIFYAYGIWVSKTRCKNIWLLKLYFLCRFLGYFQPQPDKPALWELGSDQHYNAARFLANAAVAENSRYCIFWLNETHVEKFETFLWSLETLTLHLIVFRSMMKRSLSESSILSESSTAPLGPVSRHGLAEKEEEVKGLSDLAPEISTSEHSVIASSLR